MPLQDQVGDQLGGFVVEGGGYVAVDAEGDGDRAVAEALLDGPRVDATRARRPSEVRGGQHHRRWLPSATASVIVVGYLEGHVGRSRPSFPTSLDYPFRRHRGDAGFLLR